MSGIAQGGLVVVAALAAAAATLLLVGPADRAVRRRGPRATADLLPGVPPQGGAPAGPFAWVRRRIRPGPPLPIAELLGALSAELSAGQPTSSALLAASSGLVPHPCPQAAAAARTGGDVPTALRADAGVPAARAPDSQALRGLAACWEVAEHSGAGLAVAVTRLGTGRRAAAAADAQLASELAAVRTSARLLAALPLFGLLIGQWIGARPVAWLLGGAVGRVILVAGLGLQLAGIAWLARMVSVARGRL